MRQKQLGDMLEGYDVPAILVSADYEILATNNAYADKFGKIDLRKAPKCYAVSHGYDRPCDQAGEDCPLKAARESKHREKVLHIHQTPNGREHVDVEMLPIFDDNNQLQFFVELLKPVPLASGKPSDKQLVGNSAVFNEMLSKVTKVADSDASVLLLGESGTGKELISRLVHYASKRSEQAMVTLECSGLSETLIESELFGHRKGAFTGAYNDRKGLVEMADGGTLFLDEIGDVSLATQVKLLRLLETKTFRRVGGTEVRTADFRLICATHRDLNAMVRDGQFRLDLYYRINVFPIHIPSLAQRRDDIPQLVTHLLSSINKKLYITQPALQLLLSHRFPGNVRQLKNLLIRASILSDTNVVDQQQIEQSMAMEPGITALEYSSVERVAAPPALKSNESAYIAELLKQHHGDKKAVAKALGISLRTLYRKLQSS
ncbi:sigma-54-dependent Fis family transcriptional regulator [Gammaproteobacteria bacterium LSUCC0057]|uniref:Sigma-54-dependent Fis family transcriptional regulator n=1 Tax=Gammaproteobacteria bacterium LSUCC0057 TaxID=2559237 RepID=A0A4Y8ULP2_9GAMM|nr:sigma-54-dependent Fis family transcriptional regulator [Gammaproteobacteria bacterium LSUCC0057]